MGSMAICTSRYEPLTESIVPVTSSLDNDFLNANYNFYFIHSTSLRKQSSHCSTADFTKIPNTPAIRAVEIAIDVSKYNLFKYKVH